MDTETPSRRFRASAPTPPHIPSAVVEYLNRVFPDRCAREGDTQEQIWMAAGARRVVNHLQSIRDQADPTAVQVIGAP